MFNVRLGKKEIPYLKGYSVVLEHAYEVFISKKKRRKPTIIVAVPYYMCNMVDRSLHRRVDFDILLYHCVIKNKLNMLLYGNTDVLVLDVV